MSNRTLGRVVAVIAIAAIGAVYWVQSRDRARGIASGSGPCLFEARQTASYFDSRINFFYGKPYDAAAWNAFQTEMQSRISAAKAKCTCLDYRCNSTRGAMDDLSAVVDEFSTAVQSGKPLTAPQGTMERARRVEVALQ